MDKAKRALVIFAVFAALIVVAAGLSFLIPWLGARAGDARARGALRPLGRGQGNTP